MSHMAFRLPYSFGTIYLIQLPHIDVKWISFQGPKSATGKAVPVLVGRPESRHQPRPALAPGSRDEIGRHFQPLDEAGLHALVRGEDEALPPLDGGGVDQEEALSALGQGGGEEGCQELLPWLLLRFQTNSGL